MALSLVARNILFMRRGHPDPRYLMIYLMIVLRVQMSHRLHCCPSNALFFLMYSSALVPNVCLSKSILMFRYSSLRMSK